MTIIDAQATYAPSPFHWNGRQGYTPRWIVLHGTSGYGAVSWFQNPQSQVSTNYVIEQDGRVYCSVPEDSAAYGNGELTPGHDTFWTTLNGVNPNLVTISIEHTKAPGNTEPLTPAQQAASFALIDRICTRWHIPRRAADATGGIAPHASLDPVNRSDCPGPYDWHALYAALNPSLHLQENDTMPQPLSTTDTLVSGFYEQDGAMWKCKYAYNPSTGTMELSPNGSVIGNAILSFYENLVTATENAISLLGLCVTNEMRLSMQGEVAQVFENAIAVYDPQHRLDTRPGSTSPVYLTHLFSGAGLTILKNALGHLSTSDPQVPVLEAKIAALEAQLNAQPVAPLQAEIAKLKATLAHIEQEAASAV